MARVKNQQQGTAQRRQHMTAKAQSPQTSVVTSRSGQLPTMYVPATPAEWSAIAAMANAGFSGARLILEKFNGRDGHRTPIVVTIADSHPLGDTRYQLEFSVTNYAGCGAYVESIELKDAKKNRDQEIRRVEYTVDRRGMGVTVGEDEPVLPLLVTGGANCDDQVDSEAGREDLVLKFATWRGGLRHLRA